MSSRTNTALPERLSDELGYVQTALKAYPNPPETKMDAAALAVRQWIDGIYVKFPAVKAFVHPLLKSGSTPRHTKTQRQIKTY